MFDDYDFETKYDCSPITKSKHFTKCMYLMINLDKISNLIKTPAIDVFKAYIEKNPDEVFIKNKEGWTPLMIAARNSNRLNLLECIPILLNLVTTRHKRKRSPESTETNSLSLVDYVNMTNDTGWTALAHSVRYSNTDSSLATVKLLLLNGANVNHVSDFNWSILMKCVIPPDSTDRLETIQLLLEHGAQFNPKNKCLSKFKCDDPEFKILPSRFNALKLVIQHECIYQNKFPHLQYVSELEPDQFQECMKLVTTIQHQKLCKKHLLTELQNYSPEYIYRPGSLRHTFVTFKWNLQKYKSNSQIPLILQSYLGCTHISNRTSLNSQTFDVLQFTIKKNLEF